MRPSATAPAWTTLIAAILALVVAATVPALRATAPLTAPAQWTIADLAAGAVRAATRRPAPAGQPDTLNHWLGQARSLWRQFHNTASAGAQRRMSVALALAAMIPVLAIVAGVCAVLSLIFVLWRRRRWLMGTALVGAASSAYVITASWWVTHLARTELTQALAAVQQRWGGLIAALAGGSSGGHALTAALPASLGLEPQAGLYVLLLAFLAMLLLPEGRGHTTTIGSV
ncbi:MAG TPA: hypothetical protein VIC54_04875 [Terriglobales bacterium]|jgi:hypothetical protein